MTILTSETTFTPGDSDTLITSTSVFILPFAGVGEGTGRLIHPDFGTYDYPYAPDEWVNVDSDIIIPPIWGNSRTLGGAANMLFTGYIRDIEVTERWDSELGGTLNFVRMLCNIWMNPPDPDVGYVKWSPSYVNDFTYNVIVLGVSVGGEAVTLSYVTRQIATDGNRWVEGTVELKMRLVEKVEV